MLHIIEVDQSIKIEQSGTTVLAFANGMSHAIVIPSDVKTGGLRELKARGKSDNVAHLMLFSVCLFCLLKDRLEQCEQIIIDVEYEEKDADTIWV